MARGSTVGLALALALGAGSAVAGDVRVRVQGVRSDVGRVLVALCAQAEFLNPTCGLRGSAPATAGETEVTIRDVPPGLYAAQAVHDEDDDRELDRGRLGLPREGLGFSRDATIERGPPRFGEAAVEVGPAGGILTFALRYF